MNVSWTADLNIEERTPHGLVVKASASYSGDDCNDYRDRRLCVQVMHEDTPYGIQLEWAEELDEMIDILTAIQLAAKNPPDWTITD